MNDWLERAPAWFGIAEREVARVLHLMGQDNEALSFGIVVLGLFLGLALAWAVVLGSLQSVFRLFGSGRGPALAASGPDFRDMRYDAPMRTRDEPGRLDVVPMAGPAPRRKRRPEPSAAPEPAVRAEDEPVMVKPEGRLAQAAGRAIPKRSNPLSALGGVRRVKLRSLPDLAPLASVISARPEWTGKVVPSSLEEAGAVEVCKVLSRRSMPGSTAPVRAVDYRICGLPRVDGDGHRQPDVLVYTVADRGFLPKGAQPKSAKRPI
jgi:hypothetical protein